jgi:hypothetical protein
MDIKNFLEYKKENLAIPIILILIFAYTVNVFFQLGYLGDQYYCDFATVIEFMGLSQEQGFHLLNNETMQINNTNITFSKDELDTSEKRILEFGDKFDEMSESLTVASIFKTIYPILPFPCDHWEDDFCQYYIKEESYSCLSKNLSEESVLGYKFNPPKPYTHSLSLVLAANVAILFVIGYLISCFLAVIIRRFRRQKQ